VFTARYKLGLPFVFKGLIFVTIGTNNILLGLMREVTLWSALFLSFNVPALSFNFVESEGKIQPRTGHEDPEGE
jgi:hypothetical protein